MTICGQFPYIENCAFSGDWYTIASGVQIEPRKDVRGHVVSHRFVSPFIGPEGGFLTFGFLTGFKARPMGRAESGMTMLCVTHTIGFDKTVTDRVFFIDADQITEDNEPEEFFKNPQNERTQLS